MEKILAHKIELDPNNVQETYFKKACGTDRFVCAWALDEWDRQYKAGEKPNEAKLRKQLNAIKSEKYPWMLEISSYITKYSIKNLGIAFDKFFKKKGGYPKKKKKGVNDRFRCDDGVKKEGQDSVRVEGKKVKIPVLGWVRMKEELRFKEGQIISAVISRTADRWFISLSIKIDYVVPIRENQAKNGGGDLGVKAMLTDSDGNKYEGPKALRKHKSKMKRFQQKLSRQKKGSKNRAKTKMKIAKLHARIANIRKDFIHKLTKTLVLMYSLLGIEDLNVNGMLKNHCLAFALSDMSFGEFRRQLKYKGDLYGSLIVVVSRWFASSKLCSECGYKLDKLPLNIREWICPECGCVHDRDHNAAKNLRNEAVRLTATACGVDSTDVRCKPYMELTTLKQELCFESICIDSCR